MTDYLTVKYNTKLEDIMSRESASLDAALAIYTKAVKEIVEKAASERLEAGVADAAARSQRDYEYHNGRSSVPVTENVASNGYSVGFNAGVPEIQITDCFFHDADFGSGETNAYFVDPGTSTPEKQSGANGMRDGDRVRYIDGRCGVAGEFMQDGECYVKFDDGTYETVLWNNLEPEGKDA